MRWPRWLGWGKSDASSPAQDAGEEVGGARHLRFRCRRFLRPGLWWVIGWDEVWETDSTLDKLHLQVFSSFDPVPQRKMFGFYDCRWRVRAQ